MTAYKRVLSHVYRTGSIDARTAIRLRTSTKELPTIIEAISVDFGIEIREFADYPPSPKSLCIPVRYEVDREQLALLRQQVNEL